MIKNEKTRINAISIRRSRMKDLNLPCIIIQTKMAGNAIKIDTLLVRKPIAKNRINRIKLIDFLFCINWKDW